MNVIGNVMDYGNLVFWSNPSKMCRQKRGIPYHLIFHSVPPCSTVITTVNLNTKLLNERKEFEIGFTKFKNATILFYPHNSIKLMSNISSLVYTWISNGNIKNQTETFKTRYKLINFAELNYSWTMAADKCKEFGMTLPHLENEKTTREFVSYILNEYALLIYALFVGLVRKVRILIH